MAIGIILLFIGTAFNPSTAQNIAKSSLPASTGHWLYVGGSGPGNYTKIQDAINAASTGDTIFIYHDSSPYQENIIINTTLTLLGENQTITLLDGETRSPTITINAPNTVISGLTITQKNNSWVNSTICLKTNNITIVGDTLIYGSEGVYCINCSNITIKNLTIMNVSEGLSLWYTSGSSVENNSISGCDTAIYGNTCQNCHFFNNTIYHCLDGFRMVRGDHNMYHYNKVYDNIDVGMDVDGDIQHNIISNCNYGAFVGKGIFVFNIVQNCILGMESTGFITVSYNTIQNCSFRGLMVAYFMTIVSHNNFLNNSNDASSEQAFLTRWYGNYWGKPLLGPKIIPGWFGFGYLLIPWINFDWHPAQQPYNISSMR